MRFLKKKLSDKRWMMEFSKKMLVMLSICYAATLIFTATMMVVFQDISALQVFLEQVTMVFSLGVVSYLVKSAVENVFKIKDTSKLKECIDEKEFMDQPDNEDEEEDE